MDMLKRRMDSAAERGEGGADQQCPVLVEEGRMPAAMVIEGVVEENNEVFGPPTCVDAMAEARLSPTPPPSCQHPPFRTRRWPIVYHGPSVTVDGKHWCGRGRIPRTVQRFVDVRLEAVTDASVICPIAQDSIVDADRDAPFFPPGTTYSQSMPCLNAVVLVGCEHRFSALHLLYHWVRNMTVKCPVCRRGIENAHLRQSTLPTHLRAELLARTRMERRRDKEEALRADMEAAQALAAAQHGGHHPSMSVFMGMTPLAEAPRRFVPELGTFDPGEFSPLHVIMGYTIPLVDHSTSTVLLSRAGIIPSLAVSWATLPAGRGALTPAYRARVHRVLLGTGFGQVPQAVHGTAGSGNAGSVSLPPGLVEAVAAVREAFGEVAAGGDSSNNNGTQAPPLVNPGILRDMFEDTLQSYALLRNVVYVDAFFSVIPWCLSRVSGACIELFIEHGQIEGGHENEGGAGGGGGRHVVALFRHERLSVSFGCRSGMWSMRGGVAAPQVGEGGNRADNDDEGVLRLNPPRLVSRATEDAMEVDDEAPAGEEEEESEEEDDDDDNDDDDGSGSSFENDEVARILFSASAVGVRHLGIIAGHPFRVAGGIDAMRFPPSEILDPSNLQESNGLVDVTPDLPDMPLRYLVEMQHGVVREVYFEVRLDLFCLLALEQEHVRQSALFQVVPPATVVRL